MPEGPCFSQVWPVRTQACSLTDLHSHAGSMHGQPPKGGHPGASTSRVGVPPGPSSGSKRPLHLGPMQGDPKRSKKSAKPSNKVREQLRASQDM